MIRRLVVAASTSLALCAALTLPVQGAPVLSPVKYFSYGGVTQTTAARNTGLPTGRYAEVVSTAISRSETNLVIKVDLYGLLRSNAYHPGGWYRTTSITFTVGGVQSEGYGTVLIGGVDITAPTPYPTTGNVQCVRGDGVAGTWVGGLREVVSYSGRYVIMKFPLSYIQKCGFAHGSQPVDIGTYIDARVLPTGASATPGPGWGKPEPAHGGLWTGGEAAEFRY